MKTNNTYHSKIKFIVCFFLLINFGCSQHENDIQNTLTKYHTKNAKTYNSKIEIETIVSKNLDSKYSSIFYKIKNENMLYLGIINDNNIVSIIQLQEKETVSLFNNNYCIVPIDSQKKLGPKEEDFCFTFFIGEFPHQEYSHLELEWNCSKKDFISQKLLQGKYFFFFKEGLNNKICNLKAKNNEKSINMHYNTEDASFIKETTTNKELR